MRAEALTRKSYRLVLIRSTQSFQVALRSHTVFRGFLRFMSLMLPSCFGDSSFACVLILLLKFALPEVELRAIAVDETSQVRNHDETGECLSITLRKRRF